MKLSSGIAKRLKELIKQKGITQYAIFKATGIPQSTISTIINARANSVTITSIYDLCMGLNITLKEFFDSPIFNEDNIFD